MLSLQSVELRPFIPSKDFGLSKQFYLQIGCELEWSDKDLSLLNLGGFRFYLQNRYDQAWADNSMLHITVSNTTNCYSQIVELQRIGQFLGSRVTPPKIEPYGALVTYVWDPAGVLLHLAEWIDGAR